MVEEKEEWRDAPGYENLYQVSSIGRVKRLERKVKHMNGYRTIKELILKPRKLKDGYLYANFSKKRKMKNIAVHRLVCNAFLSNPYNLPEVNHLNEIKTDNRIENLEWCTRKYNLNYGTHNERMRKALTGAYNTKISKAVRCIETGKIYPSTMEVQRKFGFNQSNISACCNGKRNTCGGYHWCYVV